MVDLVDLPNGDFMARSLNDKISDVFFLFLQGSQGRFLVWFKLSNDERVSPGPKIVEALSSCT